MALEQTVSSWRPMPAALMKPKHLRRTDAPGGRPPFAGSQKHQCRTRCPRPWRGSIGKMRHLFWTLGQGGQRTARVRQLPEDRLPVLRPSSQYSLVACRPVSGSIRGLRTVEGTPLRRPGAGSGSREEVRRRTRAAAEAGLSAGASPAALPPPDRSGSRPDRSGRRRSAGARHRPRIG